MANIETLRSPPPSPPSSIAVTKKLPLETSPLQHQASRCPHSRLCPTRRPLPCGACQLQQQHLQRATRMAVDGEWPNAHHLSPFGSTYSASPCRASDGSEAFAGTYNLQCDHVVGHDSGARHVCRCCRRSCRAEPLEERQAAEGDGDGLHRAWPRSATRARRLAHRDVTHLRRAWRAGWPTAAPGAQARRQGGQPA